MSKRLSWDVHCKRSFPVELALLWLYQEVFLFDPIDQPKNVIEYKVTPSSVRQQLEGLRVVDGPLLLVDLYTTAAISNLVKAYQINLWIDRAIPRGHP